MKKFEGILATFVAVAWVLSLFCATGAAASTHGMASVAGSEMTAMAGIVASTPAPERSIPITNSHEKKCCTTLLAGELPASTPPLQFFFIVSSLLLFGLFSIPKKRITELYRPPRS